ncbi:hypothetical protein TNCV_5060151 [Trichonephila clavipes]|nr:hypothetical protein TNCV_5060151 [Trichonephila clavipes]
MYSGLHPELEKKYRTIEEKGRTQRLHFKAFGWLVLGMQKFTYVKFIQPVISYCNEILILFPNTPSNALRAPRKAAVAHFRLRLSTDHDCLRSHLGRFGIADSLDCALCDSGQPMTTEHLAVCPALISVCFI